MKKIKEYTEITSEEAVAILKNRKLWEGSGIAVRHEDEWQEGCFTFIPYPSGFVFVPENNDNAPRWAKVTERWPNQVPEGVGSLPEPFLAYLQKGPIPEDKRPTEEEREDSPLWVCFDGHWSNGDDIPYGGNGTQHYVLDIRTAYARRCWPEIVEAMEYQEPPKWKVGDTVKVIADNGADICAGMTARVLYVRDDVVRVAESERGYEVELFANDLKPWTPGYKYLPDGNPVPPPPEGFVMMEGGGDLPTDDKEPVAYHNGQRWEIGTSGALKFSGCVKPVKFRAFARKVEPKLQLREGGFYLDRQELVQGPVKKNTSPHGSSKTYSWRIGSLTFRDGGQYLDRAEHEFDLIREVRVTELDGSPLKGGEQ